MGHDGDPSRFCERFDLSKLGDASHLGNAGLGVGDSSGGKHLLELKYSASILTCRDRDISIQAPESDEVFWGKMGSSNQ